MRITYKRALTIPEFVDAIRLRVNAFILEQGCKPGWEPDEQDKIADHYIAIRDALVVGTLRVREVESRVYKIERMVTDASQRKSGIGRELLDFAVTDIMKKDPKRIWMQAQSQARMFYEKCGFRGISEEYDHWGILHLDMEFVL